MNKRVQQLKEQATRKAMWPGDPDAGELNAELFAELIVRECMTRCDETRADYRKHRKASDDFTDKNVYAAGEAASDIIKYKMKQHFGVEE